MSVYDTNFTIARAAYFYKPIQPTSKIYFYVVRGAGLGEGRSVFSKNSEYFLVFVS